MYLIIVLFYEYIIESIRKKMQTDKVYKKSRYWRDGKINEHNFGVINISKYGHQISREYFLSDIRRYTILYASLYVDNRTSVYYQFYDCICDFRSAMRVYFIYEMRESKNNALKISIWVMIFKFEIYFFFWSVS